MPANPYKVGVNTFNQVDSDWICWGPDGKELALPDGKPAHFKIGREAREFLNELRGDKKTAKGASAGRALGKNEIHPDFVAVAKTKTQIDAIITHLVSCCWRKLGDINDDDSCRLMSPDGTRAYIHVGSRKLDRYFCWATSDDGSRIKDFDFMTVKLIEEKKETVEETVAVILAPVVEETKVAEVEKQDEII